MDTTEILYDIRCGQGMQFENMSIVADEARLHLAQYVREDAVLLQSWDGQIDMIERAMGCAA